MMSRHFLFLIPLLAAAFSPVAGAQTFSEEVNLAIERGVQNLLMLQNQDGSFRNSTPNMNKQYPMGVSALALYALLKSGVSPADPAIHRAVGCLRYKPFKKTYSVSVLILALDALRDPDHDPWIRKAASWLEVNINTDAGMWGYPDNRPDLSNTQYAVLALWVAERHGYKAKLRIWVDLLHAMLAIQNEDGGFRYRMNPVAKSTGTMTTAGIAVLTVAVGRLESDGKFGSLQRRGARALERAWTYLDRVFTATGNPSGTNGLISHQFPGSRWGCHHHYYLYGIERVAALSNRSRIGGRNWYREGALCLLKNENNGGGWGDLVNTSFALLFLRRATFSGMSQKGSTANPIGSVTWRYTFTSPPEGWASPGFDDSSWSKGAGCFGSSDGKGGVLRSVWKDPDIWLRREFVWNSDSSESFRLFALHDDDIEIYVNGVLAESRPKWSLGKYVAVKVSDAARGTVKKGRNVLAAHCRNTGGAQMVDVTLHDIGHMVTRTDETDDEARTRWWKFPLRPGVPFIRRWLVLGPLDNSSDGLLLDPLLPNLESAPTAGRRSHGSTWRLVESDSGRLDFEKNTRSRDHCLFCAFTFLRVEEETDVVLWLGADDGVRVILNGTTLLSHHVHRGTPPDGFSIPLHLTEGEHRLLIKVDEHRGSSSLCVRLAARDGGIAAKVYPVLAPEAPDWPGIAKSHPDLFTLEELLQFLPSDRRSKLDFAQPSDIERLAAASCHPDFPGWIDRSRPREDRLQPNPGAKGIAVIRPASPDVPARLIRKIDIPPGRLSLEARVSAEAHKAAGKSGCRVRLGVFDGTLKWIAEETVKSNKNPSSKGWVVMRGSLEEYVEREVLLIVEGAACGLEMDCVFLDDISLK